MVGVDDRSCYFLDCLTFYDGNNLYTFYGKSSGVLFREIKGNSIKKNFGLICGLFLYSIIVVRRYLRWMMLKEKKEVMDELQL